MNKLKISMLALCFAATFTACKKEKDDELQLDAQTEQHNKDANYYRGEADQADNDINNTLRDIPAFGKTAGLQSDPLCGCTVDSSQLSQKTLFFNFDGVTPCFSPSRTRSGQIKVQLISGNFWSDVNAVISIQFINYKVTRLSDNKSVKFNAFKTLQNVNGNDWLGFLLGSKALKYRERAFNINVDFDNGQTAIWNSARTTEWTYSAATQRISFKANGDTIVNGHSNTDSWGSNRFGTGFVINYNSPWSSNTYCGLWRPVSGEAVNHINNNQYKLTLGVDQQGNPSTLNCAYGYKISWVVDGKTGSKVISY
ncbi:MAG: hypothetical protein IPO27_09370 [Bacteroidetes bacterium]|nr:hypothetical protein [Bacteroidota bacterium]